MTSASTLHKSILLSLLLVTTGCFPDWTDDADDMAGPPPNADVEGSWRYSSLMSGEGATCMVSDVTIIFEQNDQGLVTGQTSGGTADCVRSGTLTSEPLPSFTIEDGLVIGASIRFSFESRDFWKNAGNVSGDLMGGATDWQRDFGDDIGVLFLSQGNFEAVRANGGG